MLSEAWASFARHTAPRLGQRRVQAAGADRDDQPTSERPKLVASVQLPRRREHPIVCTWRLARSDDRRRARGPCLAALCSRTSLRVTSFASAPVMQKTPGFSPQHYTVRIEHYPSITDHRFTHRDAALGAQSAPAACTRRWPGRGAVWRANEAQASRAAQLRVTRKIVRSPPPKSRASPGLGGERGRRR